VFLEPGGVEGFVSGRGKVGNGLQADFAGAPHRSLNSRFNV
jgi:hypothetical protein